MLLVHVALDRAPGGARREAGRRQRIRGGVGPVALIVVGIETARVVGVITNLLHVAIEIAAGVDEIQAAHLAVDRPGRILELVLVVGIVEQRYFEPWQ